MTSKNLTNTFSIAYPIVTDTGNTFSLIQASSAQAGVVRELLTEAAAWMQREGIQQWKPEQFSFEEVETYFENRLVFLAFDGEKPAGLFTLQHSDMVYWKTADDPDYYYLHKFTVSTDYRSCGLGKAILEWAMNKASKDQKKGLRLDCRSASSGLNRYYRSQGFAFKGTSEQQDHWANLYEKLLP